MSARKTNILIIDDDTDLREELAEQLGRQDGFAVAHAATVEDGIAAVRATAPKLILLDVNLPDGDGREACRRLRAEGVSTPIVLLTAVNEDGDVIDGLDAGANDYVAKPFKFEVLLARLRAHLRIHEQSDEAELKIGPYAFRPSQRILVDARERRLRLTDKETAILKYLYRAGDKPVPREELLREVWGYNANVTTHTLETHVYRLRQKIEPGDGGPRLLITEAGGYRLAP